MAFKVSKLHGLRINMNRKNVYELMLALFLIVLSGPSFAHHEFCHSGPDVHANLECDGGEISIKFGDVRGFWDANEESKVKARVIKLFKERFNYWNKISGYEYDVVEKCDTSATDFLAVISLSRLSVTRFVLSVRLTSKEYPKTIVFVTEAINVKDVDVFRYFDCYFADTFHQKYWWVFSERLGGWKGYCQSYFSTN